MLKLEDAVVVWIVGGVGLMKYLDDDDDGFGDSDDSRDDDIIVYIV